MKAFRVILLLILGLCLMVQTSWATNAYVTDSFKITLRRGPSIENKIITFLVSGQPVEVLESQDDWSHVRVLEHERGEMEGWVMSRFLITRLPWETEANSLRQGNTRLKEKLAHIDKEWKQLKENTKALHELEKKYKALTEEAADYLKVKAAYEGTLATLEATQEKVQTLSKENDRLETSQRNRWFAMGALVLLFGLLIGFIMGRQHKRRSSLY